jgi:hypothetical protein
MVADMIAWHFILQFLQLIQQVIENLGRCIAQS